MEIRNRKTEQFLVATEIRRKLFDEIKGPLVQLLEDTAKEEGLFELSLFGSAKRGECDEQSDLDISITPIHEIGTDKYRKAARIIEIIRKNHQKDKIAFLSRNPIKIDLPVSFPFIDNPEDMDL